MARPPHLQLLLLALPPPLDLVLNAPLLTRGDGLHRLGEDEWRDEAEQHLAPESMHQNRCIQTEVYSAGPEGDGLHPFTYISFLSS